MALVPDLKVVAAVVDLCISVPGCDPRVLQNPALVRELAFLSLPYYRKFGAKLSRDLTKRIPKGKPKAY